MISNIVRFWLLLIISLALLGAGILSLVRALQGGGSIQYLICALMMLGFLFFGFVALATKRGKWLWE